MPIFPKLVEQYHNDNTPSLPPPETPPPALPKSNSQSSTNSTTQILNITSTPTTPTNTLTHTQATQDSLPTLSQSQNKSIQTSTISPVTSAVEPTSTPPSFHLLPIANFYGLFQTHTHFATISIVTTLTHFTSSIKIPPADVHSLGLTYSLSITARQTDYFFHFFFSRSYQHLYEEPIVITFTFFNAHTNKQSSTAFEIFHTPNPKHEVKLPIEPPFLESFINHNYFQFSVEAHARSTTIHPPKRLNTRFQ